MAGLVPAIYGFLAAALKTWMPGPSPRQSGFGRAGGTSPGMTVIKLLRCEYASPPIPRSPFFCATRALLGESCAARRQGNPGRQPMAMTMNGEVQLAAPREMVWSILNDPEVLKACIPGCEELEKTEDNGFRAVGKMKVGPVSARFKGRVTLSDLDPPNGYRISGEGEGGVAGFAKGGATV